MAATAHFCKSGDWLISLLFPLSSHHHSDLVLQSGHKTLHLPLVLAAAASPRLAHLLQGHQDHDQVWVMIPKYGPHTLASLSYLLTTGSTKSLDPRSKVELVEICNLLGFGFAVEVEIEGDVGFLAETFQQEVPVCRKRLAFDEDLNSNQVKRRRQRQEQKVRVCPSGEEQKFNKTEPSLPDGFKVREKLHPLSDSPPPPLSLQIKRRGRPFGKTRKCQCPNCQDVNGADGHICHFSKCGKTFNKICHLESHLRNHIGARPYQCPEPGCGAKFVRSDELKRHSWAHNPTSRFTCQVCDKRFDRADKFNRHTTKCIQTNIVTHEDKECTGGTNTVLESKMGLESKRGLESKKGLEGKRVFLTRKII